MSIASYRDPECQHTVRDLFAKATYPERLRIGIVWQYNKEEDSHCFEHKVRPEYEHQVRMNGKVEEGEGKRTRKRLRWWLFSDKPAQLDSHYGT